MAFRSLVVIQSQFRLRVLSFEAFDDDFDADFGGGGTGNAVRGDENFYRRLLFFLCGGESRGRSGEEIRGLGVSVGEMGARVEWSGRGIIEQDAFRSENAPKRINSSSVDFSLTPKPKLKMRITANTQYKMYIAYLQLVDFSLRQLLFLRKDYHIGCGAARVSLASTPDWYWYWHWYWYLHHDKLALTSALTLVLASALTLVLASALTLVLALTLASASTLALASALALGFWFCIGVGNGDVIVLTNLTILKEQTMMRQDHHDPNAQDMKLWKRMGCDGEIDIMLRIRLREAGSDEEIFTLVAWIRAFNIHEPIYVEICHEFYSTYEFDEVCADDELQTKKIIKFRLGGHAHNLTLLEFARRLGLYQAVKLEEEGFNTPKWVCKCSLGDCEMDEEERSWDSERESNFLWDLDTTTLRDLIDFDGKLILVDP
ncbi:hypothetical protein Tco_0972357 [Tanacetum coccineum]